MIEVELKAFINNHNFDEVKGRLELIGFKRLGLKEETDIYFNGNNRDFRKTDEALRLRKTLDLISKETLSFITYKGPKLDQVSQTRNEHEVEIDDFEKMQNILINLGYTPVLNIRKVREYFRNAEITACLDKVDGLGTFLELEKMEHSEDQKPAALTELNALLDSLGIPKTDLTIKSYLELLLGL